MSSADLVFTGGRVFTADAVRSQATSVAVTGGRIVAVGNDEVLDLIGPNTEVVQLEGRMLTPGFQDAHVHPVWGGLDLMRCDLSGERTRDGYLARLTEYAAENPDLPWVLGGGWSMAAFPGGTPLASDLDRIVPDRPAFLPNRDGHGAWVNSAALELAGLTKDSPDPVDGRIERDADRAPSGTLHEGAMSLVNRHLPETSPEDMLEALLLGQRYLQSFGITAWQDAIIGSYGDAGNPAPAYMTAAASGQLTSRVVGALWWDRWKGLEQIPYLVEQRERLQLGKFAATTIKIMQDGVPENFTAAMIEPYLDGPNADPHNHGGHGSGLSFVEVEILNEAVPALDALGFQVHFHAIGDRAVRECLDAVQISRERNGLRGNRHHIAHLQVVHPDDIPRFRELDVTANMQMLWAALETQMVELTLPFIGPERAAWQYPFGDLMRDGAGLACGSDWSVSTPNPLAAIHVAVNRVTAPGQEETVFDPFLPEQAIDLATALTAYTAGSAYVNGSADSGIIAVGNVADFALLDRNPFEAPTSEIGLTRVDATYIDGVRVFRREQ